MLSGLTFAALAVTNVLLLPMAFVGGLFLPSDLFPSWLDRASTFLPNRAGRELLVGTVTAVLAYRRDEGQRFR